MEFLGTAGFMPHGYCISWSPVLLWLNIISDSVISVSYYAIPFILFKFAGKKNLPYPWILKLFALFIIACGTTHLFGVITIWKPLYWLDVLAKAVTAISSAVTAAALFWIMPIFAKYKSSIRN